MIYRKELFAMKKKIRIIALAMAFCIVFAISASAYQIDAVHRYDYFQPLTDISCHGYLGVSNTGSPGEYIGIWASTEISHAVDIIISMTVSCSFNGPNGAEYGSAQDAVYMTNTQTVIMAENTYVAPINTYGFLEAYHFVEFEDPGTLKGSTWSATTNGIYA